MSVKVYNKLIRDRIPQIIENKGGKPVIEKLNSENYKRMLDIKLQEELDEYLKDDSSEELADLVEVVYAILDYKNISLEDFETIRQKKAAERGAFKERLLLKEVIEN